MSRRPGQQRKTTSGNRINWEAHSVLEIETNRVPALQMNRRSIASKNTIKQIAPVLRTGGKGRRLFSRRRLSLRYSSGVPQAVNKKANSDIWNRRLYGIKLTPHLHIV